MLEIKGLTSTPEVSGSRCASQVDERVQLLTTTAVLA